MKTTQIAEIVNAGVKAALGETAVVAEDLSNIVEVGREILGTDDYLKNYAKGILNKVGRSIFVNRPLSSSAPSIMRDAWEYGSILEKVTVQMPDATVNESWELTNGQTYNQDIYTDVSIVAKYFNKRVTFEIDQSFLDKQIKQSFASATAMAAFIASIYTAIENKFVIALDNLIHKTINNLAAETIYNEYESADYAASSGVRAVNLFYLFKQKNPDTTLTAATCYEDPDFIRFASNEMKNYIDYLKKASVLFNLGGIERHTPADRLHVVMLSQFTNAADTYLQSDVWHNELTKLPLAETVAFWQGSGTKFEFADTSRINVKTADGHDVNVNGVLSVMFDHDAAAVTNEDRRITTHYNAKAEFHNNFYKVDMGYLNDFNENCVVFFVA